MSEQNQSGGQSSSIPASLKKELEETQKMTEGTFTPEDSDAGNAEDTDENDSKEDDNKGADAEGEEESEDSNDADADNTDDADEDESEGEDDSNDDAGQDDSAEHKDRKVVPIKLLHDEKRKRKDIETQNLELTKRVSELEGITKNTDAGSQKEADAIKKWAEKNGYDASEMEELAGIIRAGTEVNQETLLKNVFGEGVDIKSIQQAVKLAQVTTETATFESEFKQLEPELKKQFPNATPEQLEAARKKLDDISHSEWGHDKDLDYILFKKKETFGQIFKTAPKAKVGPEGSRIGQGAPRGLTAKDFIGKDAKPFTELTKLPEADQKKIIKEFDPFTKVAYWNSLGGRSGDVIKRAGRTVAKI